MATKKTAKKKAVKKKTVKKNTKNKKDKTVVNKKSSKGNEVKKKKVKKKESNDFLNSKYLFPIVVIVIIILIALAITNFVNAPCAFSKFDFTINGLHYCSNEYAPTTFFEEFAQNKTVYVSPILLENNSDPLIANAMNLWQVILIGNNIEAIQLIRASNGNEVTHCYTNFGDIKTMEQISLEECNAIINNSENMTVLIEEGREKVTLESNKISVFYSTSKVVGQVNFEVLKQIFPNAETVLSIVNEKIYGIN